VFRPEYDFGPWRLAVGLQERFGRESLERRLAGMNGFQQDSVRIEWLSGCRNALPQGLGLAPGKNARASEDERYPSHPTTPLDHLRGGSPHPPRKK